MPDIGDGILTGVFEMKIEGQSTDHEALHVNIRGKTTSCPHCKGTVPTTLYCLKCGFPLFNRKGDQEMNKSTVGNEFFDLVPLKDIQDDASLQSGEAAHPPLTPVDSNEMREGIELALKIDEPDVQPDLNEAEPEESVVAGDHESMVEDVDLPSLGKKFDAGGDMARGDEQMRDALGLASHPEDYEESCEDSDVAAPFENRYDKSECEMDTEITDLTKELMNSISLQLWSMNLLREGGVDEGHFSRIFQGYKDRFERCVAHRNEMLQEARDMAPLEKKINEAKVQLGELEVRRSLGDLHEGEYDAMAPALRWTIDHHEDQVANRKGEIALLTNLHQLMPAEYIVETKEMAEMTHEAMEGSGLEDVGPKTVSRIRASLKEILAFLIDS